MADQNFSEVFVTSSISLSSSSGDERTPLTDEFDNESIHSDNSYLAPYPNFDENALHESTPGSPVEIPGFADFEDCEVHTAYPSVMSRTFSVPSKLQMTTLAGEDSPTSAGNNATRNSQSSVKHLTCFWWKEKGVCRFADKDCLYAHYDTGHYTEPPRQLVPGEPALAGRKLDRAMRNMTNTQRSSASIATSLPASRLVSRASTPGFEYNSVIASPLQIYHPQTDLARLTNDNQFLKNLVEQNAKEKAIFMSHIEELQAENKGMKAELDGLRKAQEQLLAEREGLQARIHHLEHQAAVARGLNAPFGAIGTYGRARMNTETRFLGGLLDD